MNETKELGIPLEIAVLPIRGGVIFPNLSAPLVVTQARSIKLVDEVLAGTKLACIVTQKNPDTEEAGPNDLYRIGTVAVISKLLSFQDGGIRLQVQGLKRAIVVK